MLRVLRKHNVVEWPLDELPWELRVLGTLIEFGADTPDVCERCGGARPVIGRLACQPCIDAHDVESGPATAAAAPGSDVDGGRRGRTVHILDQVADLVRTDVSDDLYVRQAVQLLGELCGHVLAGDQDTATDTMDLLERLDRMVNDPAAL
jgi:hypothetical protein